MGLDMYLYAKKYIWCDNDDERTKLNAALPCPFSEDPKEITYEVMYWRKMNAIHAWFVERVQDGNDDCGDYWVSKDQLVELRDLCQKVIEIAKIGPGEVVVRRQLNDGEWKDVMEEGIVIVNPDEVAAILPTTEGGFFGSTDYTGHYLDEIKRTEEVLDKVLACDLEGWAIEYHSSW
jgi:hypothetical protein